MKKALHTTLRLGLTGATVVGIGWAFLTLNPPSASSIDPTQEDQAPISLVKESKADIFGMSFAAPNRTQKFMEALDRLGHEPPRSYDANGNNMFFSTAVTHKMPEEVMRDYQREFVNQGLNTEMYTHSPFELLGSEQDSVRERAFKMIDAAMKGEMIPQAVSRDHIAMGGANMLLPEEEFEGKPEKQFASKTDIVTSTHERYLAAYKACKGDMQLYNTALAAQNAAPNPQEPNPEAKALGETAKRVEQAAKATGSCANSGGGVCAPEIQSYNEASQQLAALQESITQQPNLQECPQMQAAHRAMTSATFKDARQRIKALRYIEAIRDNNSQTTSVTAVWSDEDMDAKKFMTETFGYPKDAALRGEVPTCPNCRRTWNFGGNDQEKDFVTDAFLSNDSVSRVSEFYLRELQSQGWQRTTSDLKAQELMNEDGVKSNTQYMRFARGDKFLTVRVGPGADGQTEVLTNSSD